MGSWWEWGGGEALLHPIGEIEQRKNGSRLGYPCVSLRGSHSHASSGPPFLHCPSPTPNSVHFVLHRPSPPSISVHSVSRVRVNLSTRTTLKRARARCYFAVSLHLAHHHSVCTPSTLSVGISMREPQSAELMPGAPSLSLSTFTTTLCALRQPCTCASIHKDHTQPSSDPTLLLCPSPLTLRVHFVAVSIYELGPALYHSPSSPPLRVHSISHICGHLYARTTIS